MFPYWLLFLLFAALALAERTRAPGDHLVGLEFLLAFLVMALMIGLRLQVGADYAAYEILLKDAGNSDLVEALEAGDPGYQFVNWLVGQWDGAMWQVNLICAAIFCWGLARFSLRQPAPMLAALVAVPYLVIVVAMGYTRQAVAIGVIMAGLASIDRRGSIARFVVYVAVATLFHRTALIILPLAIFAGHRNRILNVIAVVGAGFGLYSAFLQDSVDVLVQNYIEARYGSQGAAIRVAMSVAPAALLLLAGRKLGLHDDQLRFWRLVALLALACVPALFFVPSTTAIDRIALYLIPVQIVVLSRLVILLRSPAIARLAVVAYSFVILFVWLNLADHSYAWIPYRSVIGW